MLVWLSSYNPPELAIADTFMGVYFNTSLCHQVHVCHFLCHKTPVYSCQYLSIVGHLIFSYIYFPISDTFILSLPSANIFFMCSISTVVPAI